MTNAIGKLTPTHWVGARGGPGWAVKNYYAQGRKYFAK